MKKRKTNPIEFDNIVKEVFAPIYPVIAQQIVDKTQIKSGKCLDAGCGTGALGRAFAKITQMDILFYDQSKQMLELSQKYTQQEELEKRSSFIMGDIHDIVCDSQSIDLVISRGSFGFWEDWQKAYEEIYRILKIGASAYIGGGFGNKKLHEQIINTMKNKNPNWSHPKFENLETKKKQLPQIIKNLNPKKFEIIDDESGFWVYFTK